MSVVAAAEDSVGVRKQLAVLQGEVDGLACKLNGYERALQDCEFELAERDLQVVLLKSFIRNLDNPNDLQLNFQEVLEHNEHLQQQLQELSDATHHASAPATPAAGPATTAMQVSLLRAALAEANYRLAAAGLLPVAATRLQEVSRSQDTTGFLSNLTASTPIIKRSFSRLFRNKYSTNSSKLPGSSTITPSSSTSSRSSPCAPALCLASKLSEGAAAEGPDTPSGLDSKAPALRHVDSHSEALLSYTTPAPSQATAAATTASAMTASLDAAFTAAAQPEAQAAGAVSTAGVGAERSRSGFEDVEPYAYTTGEFSDAEEDSANSSSPQHTAQVTCTPASPSICLLGSPSKALTPPCSPCSSISCDSVGGGGMRRSYAVDLRMPRSLTGWPGVTCSCDNPLFDAEEVDRWAY